MSHRSTVSPSTLPVDLREEGVVVEYLDGREAFYRGVPEKVEHSVRTRPGVLVQVLVMDPTDTEGVLTYVNDRNTHDNILEETGVGRVFVEPGEETELFPGVTARADGHAVIVEADPETAGGRVFVFAEDELQERSFEIVNEDSDGRDATDENAEGEDASEGDARTDGGAAANDADGSQSDEDDGTGRDDGEDDSEENDDADADDAEDEADEDDAGTVDEGDVDAGRVDDAGSVGDAGAVGGSGSEQDDDRDDGVTDD